MKKIKEFIEYEKKDFHVTKEEWKKIKDEIKMYKEQKKYLSTYNTDLVHQELKEDFNKVLDNIESLANTFEFNMGIEIVTLSAILLHGGYLSVTSK